MAKTPSLPEIFVKPQLVNKLSTLQLHDLVESLKKINFGGRGAALDKSPGAMAARLSGGEWWMAPHLQLLSDALADLEAGRRQRIIVSMPPRHGKSFLISQWFPLWFLARNPKRRVILASYEADFAADWGRRVRGLVIEHGQELGIELDRSSMAAYRWNLTAGGGMITAGANGPVTGKGANALIIDDPIKNEEEASSDVMREKLWKWFETTAFTRLEPTALIVLVATRWHQDDLMGRLERQSITGEGLPWDIIKLPALAEEGDTLGRAVGEPLWPQRYDANKLAEIRQALSPYHWSALYQQRPSPEEGGAVKRRWWQYYRALPAKFDQVVQSWDLSFKDAKKSDFTAGQVWGRVGAEFYLIHQVRDRMNAPEVLSAARNLSAQYPAAVAKLIEDRANGPAVIAMLHKELTGIIPVKIKASKDARLQAVIPMIEARNVWLPHPDDAPWVTDFVEECAAFPNGAHDDQLDAMVHALTYLMPGGWRTVALAQKAANEGPPPETAKEIQDNQMRQQYKRTLDRFSRRFNHRPDVMRLGRGRVRAW